MKHLLVLITVIGLLLCSGCISSQSGKLVPGVSAERLRSFYVVTDNKGDVTDAIQRDLALRGFSVSSGPASGAAYVDAKVVSKDKWMWDITMYLLEVNIDLIDPRNGALIGAGRSYRTSLARRSPDEMVREIFDKMLLPAPDATPTSPRPNDTSIRAYR